MKNQKELEELIQKYISGEATAEEQKILHQSAETNPELNELLKLHGELENPENHFEIPEESSFQKMRQDTINKLYKQREKRLSIKLSSLLDSILVPFRIPAFTSSLAAATLIIGFLFGNMGTEGDLLRSINSSARQSNNLQSSTDAPYFYSNAQFKELDDGSMEVSFDVSRHIDYKGQKNDPLIQDILAQSLVTSNNMPNSLRYISKSEKIMHPKIKEALITAMLYDEHSIVRQKSMSSLLKYPNDEIVQQALFHVLQNEQSIYMKLAAIDYLTKNNVDEELINSGYNNFNSLKNSTVKQNIKQLNYNN